MRAKVIGFVMFGAALVTLLTGVKEFTPGLWGIGQNAIPCADGDIRRISCLWTDEAGGESIPPVVAGSGASELEDGRLRSGEEPAGSSEIPGNTPVTGKGFVTTTGFAPDQELPITGHHITNGESRPKGTLVVLLEADHLAMTVDIRAEYLLEFTTFGPSKNKSTDGWEGYDDLPTALAAACDMASKVDDQSRVDTDWYAHYSVSLAGGRVPPTC